MCRHCDGGFGSRNMMFKHLKKLGSEKHDLIWSVEGSPPSTDEGRRAGPALQDQHRQGGPANSKPTVTWADLSDDEQLRGANHGSWKSERVPNSLACDTVRRPRPEDVALSVKRGPANWADEEAAHMGALKDRVQEDAMEVIRAKHDSKVDVGEVWWIGSALDFS